MSDDTKQTVLTPDEEFSLERLEFLAHSRRHEQAVAEMWKLLRHLEGRYGELGDIGNLPSGNLPGDQRDAHIASRIAGAIAALFADPAFQLSNPGFNTLIPLQRWLAIIFGASPLGTADHVIRLLNQDGYQRRDQMTLTDRDLLRFCLLFGPDSQIPIQPEVLWQKNKRLAAALFFALLSPRIVITEQAQAKRDFLLQWLQPKLKELSLDDFPLDILHVWMSCSYADHPDKHAIKREINDLVRRKLLSANISDLESNPVHSGSKPVLLCIVEWFYSTHAMYRGHSLAIESLRSTYRLIGVSLKSASDEYARRVFDEVHTIPNQTDTLVAIRHIRELAAAVRPAVVYYPSVGMFLETIFLMSLRLAPIQMIALGHPATTHSRFIDYVLIEEDCIGDPACFSERLVALPPGSMPFRPPANFPKVEPRVRKTPDPVRIAVAATSMKINPRFLETLQRVTQRSKVRVELHFFSGMARGLTKVYLQNLINRVLPGSAVVYPHLSYDRYIENINRCDMFLNPFPFGNTNGIVDTVRQGLAGVCMTGAEVHSRIDEALFRRLGLPGWLITHSTEEYIAAALRLAENHAEREALGHQILRTDPDAILFQGRPEGFVQAVEWLHRNHARLMAGEARLLRPPAEP